MSAQYLITYKDGANQGYLYLHAADAKSMKRADLTAATRNAVKRAKAKLAKKGVKAVVTDCRCVG